MKIFDIFERNGLSIGLGVFIVISIGGIVEIIPSFYDNARPLNYSKPYTALELTGRLIYITEGCVECHSQLVRPFKIETDRYGHYSLSGEYAYDRPFLFGSRRIGPDLFRVGARRSVDWLEAHFLDAESTSPGTLMPDYTDLFTNSVDYETVYSDMYTQKVVFHVPYDEEGMPPLGEFEDMKESLLDEAKEIGPRFKTKAIRDHLENDEVKEVVALVAFLLRRR
ncbi:MAG: cytochrome-c oxidase, cbb3-type subunit II [SAR324 cluster bacterium]|nr:cytochrome-c oxidase, cbb3-type subunit II [SAR324 cluster bacterium]